MEKDAAVQQERLRISREMHDDIGAGLTQITLMSHAAKQYQEVGINNQHELEEISRSCRNLIGNMGEIIWSLNHKNNTLDDFFVYLRERINKLMEYTEMEFTVTLPENCGQGFLSSEQQRNILLATREIIHNSIKHSFAKKILVHGKIEGQKLMFTIADDGIGFDHSNKPTGNGLKNIHQRIQEINGEMHICSLEGKGTRFVVTVPLATTT